MTLEIRAAPFLPESRERLLAVLGDHARDLGVPFEGELLQIEAWEDDRWAGGLTARTYQRWFFVELLAVAPEMQGRGLGGRLMEEAERQARLFLAKRLDGRPVREAAPDRPVHEGIPP